MLDADVEEGPRHLHKTYCNFEHIVAQSEVAEAIPSSQSSTTGTMFQLMELTFGILVQTRHLEVSLDVAECMTGLLMGKAGSRV